MSIIMEIGTYLLDEVCVSLMFLVCAFLFIPKMFLQKKKKTFQLILINLLRKTRIATIKYYPYILN